MMSVILMEVINMKIIWITLAVLFIIVTLGFIDVKIVFSDGNSLIYGELNE